MKIVELALQVPKGICHIVDDKKRTFVAHYTDKTTKSELSDEEIDNLKNELNSVFEALNDDADSSGAPYAVMSVNS